MNTLPAHEIMISSVLSYLCLAALGAVAGSLSDRAVSYWAAGRGRCTGEGASFRRLWAELAGAIAFICVGLAFGPVAELGQWLMFTVLLLALSLADCTAQTIPDPLVLALAVGRAVWALVLRQPLKEAVLAALAACAVPTALLGVVLLAERLMDREIMGSGDMKLLFAVALYLTWPQMLLGLLAMSLLGLSFALLTGRVWGPKLPLSPFFAAGMVVSLCFGGPPIQWYLSLF